MKTTAATVEAGERHAKHTPGKWECKRENDGLHGIRISASGWIIADVWHNANGQYAPSEREAAYNARLVAAAPELLEACRQLLIHGLKGADDKRLVLMACKRDALNEEELESAEEMGRAATLARAAIAKAEGNQ